MFDHQHALATQALEQLRWENEQHIPSFFSRKVSNTLIAGIPYYVPSAHARVQLKARVETAQTILNTTQIN